MNHEGKIILNINIMISRMTLEEKASLCSGLDLWHTKPIPRFGVPSVTVADGPHGLRKQGDSGDHLGIHASKPAVCFPAGCLAASTFNQDIIRQMGEALGISCRQEGIAVLLGPAVNIKRSPLCGRNFEYFSEDPCLAAEMARSFVIGVQSMSVSCCVKHFAANNQENHRMTVDVRVSQRALREIYLPAFEAAVREANVRAVMSSYNKINGEYASQNQWLLTELLRDEWGFSGIVISDWNSVAERVKALKAGLDLEMPGSGSANDNEIVKAVRDGRFDEALLDQTVERLLEMVFRTSEGLPTAEPWNLITQHKLAAEIAEEGMVLLKNEGGLLPLIPGQDIAVIGQFALQPRFQGGGSSHVSPFRVDSLMDALQGQPGISFAQGYDIFGELPDEGLIEEAVVLAKASKIVVVVAGLPDAYESEGYDRTHLNLPQCQNELILRVAQANPNLVVVLYNGSPVLMPWLDEVKGVLEGYLGGQGVGIATKNLLFGDANPSGRLQETFPLRMSDLPGYLCSSPDEDVELYSEDVFVGYRYYDKRNLPVLFPFGFGLSYTEFAYSGLTSDNELLTEEGSIHVEVRVTNIGIKAGKEVVQLYVMDAKQPRYKPTRELRGFDKVFLKPGESKTVCFTLNSRDFSYWNEGTGGNWLMESGEYMVQIGKSSRDIVLEKTVRAITSKEPARKYSRYTSFKEAMEDPKARAVLAPLIREVAGVFGGDDEVRDSAINTQLKRSLLEESPLYAAVNYTGGQITHDMLDSLIEKLSQLE